MHGRFLLTARGGSRSSLTFGRFWIEPACWTLRFLSARIALYLMRGRLSA